MPRACLVLSVDCFSSVSSAAHCEVSGVGMSANYSNRENAHLLELFPDCKRLREAVTYGERYVEDPHMSGSPAGNGCGHTDWWVGLY